MRLLTSSLAVSPAPTVRWEFDTFGNSVALLTFPRPADELVIASELTVRRYGYDEPATRLALHAGPYPFRYGRDERVDLAPMLLRGPRSARASLQSWLAAALPVHPAETMALLDNLVQAIHEGFTYGRRDEQGVQSPAETIRLGSGTCRDLAVLFIEAARTLGFAARFVTGYLYDPATDLGRVTPTATSEAVSGGGATHAWADVFVPGVGWVEFDPTNRIIAGRNLIRIAATRTAAQALPLVGTYAATGARPLGMDVQVAVSRED
ncbi:Transglutaminase-like enzyme, putative cysteine protease [Paracoccus tibetensis]|uniref:Transglutaminase-like enzyme, putative cysteine protease n=2 Tax=Paracoccus tibetensis TaxID=336292 RepID=A0A1G5GRG8_9RHOB|nr:Transglutaminase-like enzyme, putative cysteine protease [Paracoccus tibetensis]